MKQQAGLKSFIKAGHRKKELTIQSCGRREALHVGGGHNVLQEGVAVSERRVHSHLVLPFKLSPHIPAQVHAQRIKCEVSEGSLECFISLRHIEKPRATAEALQHSESTALGNHRLSKTAVYACMCKPVCTLTHEHAH